MLEKVVGLQLRLDVARGRTPREQLSRDPAGPELAVLKKVVHHRQRQPPEREAVARLPR